MILTPLRPYQTEAVEKALQHDGFGLFMEQRTGKTLTALSIVDRRRPRQLFIVCPKRAIPVWEGQLKEHLKTTWPMKVELINFESLGANRKELYRQADKWHKRSMIIIDESHRMKKRGSRQSRSCRTISKRCQWRLILTGTPLSPKSWTRKRKSGTIHKTTAGLEDAWAQFDLIDPSIFGSYEEFEAKYLKLGGFRGLKVIGYRNEEEFRELFQRYSFRRTLGEVQQAGGVKRTIIRRVKVPFKLSTYSWIPYREIESELRTVVNDVQIESKVVVATAIKLQQITGGAILDADRRVHQTGNEKLKALMRTIDICATRGRKAVIICRFIHEIERIREYLKDRFPTMKDPKVIRGGEPFDGNFDCKFIILQIQSAISIDLSAADSIIFYSWNYSHIDYEQGRFRVLSYDKRQISYYYLIAEGTIDELLYQSSTRKSNFATLVCDTYRKRGGHGR